MKNNLRKTYKNACVLMTGKQSFQEDYYITSTDKSCGACCFLLFFFFLFAMWKLKQEVGRQDILYHMNTFYHHPQLFFYWYLMESLRIKGTSGWRQQPRDSSMSATQRISKTPRKGWFWYLKTESERHVLIKLMFENQHLSLVQCLLLFTWTTYSV